jgi:hypothetical protein
MLSLQLHAKVVAHDLEPRAPVEALGVDSVIATVQVDESCICATTVLAGGVDELGSDCRRAVPLVDHECVDRSARGAQLKVAPDMHGHEADDLHTDLGHENVGTGLGMEFFPHLKRLQEVAQLSQ